MIRKSPMLVLTITAALSTSQAPAEVVTTQQAIVQTGNGGAEVLRIQTVPVLEPRADQVLIKVHAAAVNPIDWKMREGYSGRGRPIGTPPPDEPPARIPGFDAAGTIVKIGLDVTDLQVGAAVFTMIGRVNIDGLNGTYAEYVVAPADRVAPKPEGFSFTEAAGLGMVGLTAVRVLQPVNIQPGQRVFIDGIAGGVGSSVAQMAKARGAIVIGTASARHHAYLRSIGVDQVIDYTKVQFEEVVEPVDLYVETVSVEIATRGLQIIKPDGKMVSVVGFPAAELCEEAGVNCLTMRPLAGSPGPSAVTEAELLEQVRGLANAGKYRVNVDKTFPLARAGDAQEYNRQGHTTGKVILIVDQEP